VPQVRVSNFRSLDPWLAAILLGALLLRLLYPALVGLPDRTPLHGFVVDEAEYYGAASVLAGGRGLSFYDTFTWTRTPAYVLLVGALFALFGPHTEPVFVLQAGLSVLTLWALAWLAGRAAARAPALGLSRRAAERTAALIGAVWLPFTLFANLLLSETLFLLLMVGAFVLLARYADARLPVTGAADRAGGAGTVLGAGLLLGAAALTRSTALGFIPVAVLWVGWVAWRAVPGRRIPWRAPALVLAGALLLLVPQVVRNYVAYHGLILGDTSSSFNLWLASVGVRDGARLAGDLAAISSPLDKQSYAYSQAFANITVQPLAFLAKGVRESRDLWTINFTAEERQTRGYTLGRVPAVHLWSLLAGEDLLYVLIVLVALLGLAAGPPDPFKALVGLWTLLWMAMAFVFFAVTRFRFPVVAMLLPWVPLGGAYLRTLLPARIRAQAAGRVPRPSRRAAGLYALGLLFAILVVPTIPLDETATGAARWAAQAPYRAAVPLVTSRPAAALDLLARAAPDAPDTLYATDAAQLAQEAMADVPDPAVLDRLANRPEVSLGPGSPLGAGYEPYLLSGAIARLSGDPAGARSAFRARAVQTAGAEAVDWAARFLLPPRTNRLDLGGDLDFGAPQGFYNSESSGSGDAAITYRWSGPASLIRLRPATPWRTLVIRWSGARPPGVAPAQVTATLRVPGGDTLQTITLPTSDTWVETVLRPSGATPVTSPRVELRLDANSFVPGGYDPRTLGVRVDWVELR
jgi:4-amino-4-deoxy-L-arabinose transferase-like glycosyltransferase